MKTKVHITSLLILSAGIEKTLVCLSNPADLRRSGQRLMIDAGYAVRDENHLSGQHGLQRQLDSPDRNLSQYPLPHHTIQQTTSQIRCQELAHTEAKQVSPRCFGYLPDGSWQLAGQIGILSDKAYTTTGQKRTNCCTIARPHSVNSASGSNCRFFPNRPIIVSVDLPEMRIKSTG